MNYFKTNFAMVQHHKWALDVLEEMLPWERLVYVQLLQQYMKEEAEKVQMQQLIQKAQAGKRAR